MWMCSWFCDSPDRGDDADNCDSSFRPAGRILRPAPGVKQSAGDANNPIDDRKRCTDFIQQIQIAKKLQHSRESASKFAIEFRNEGRRVQTRFVSRWILASVLASHAAVAALPQPLRPVARPAAKGAVHIQVQNGLFHVMDDVMLTIPRLDAWMIPKPGGIVTLDSKNSFILQINSGETYLSAKDLTGLLNGYLLPHAKTPIKNITVDFTGGEIMVKGDLRKGIDIPFEGKGVVSLADDSDIRVHFTEIKAAGVLKKGLLDFLGIKLSSVAQPEKQSRFRIEGDDIILPITALFPPPRISGKLTAVRIEGEGLVQVFGPPNAAVSKPPTTATNFIYFHGGRMKFGKMTMEDVDLQVVDKDPSNDFDFSLDHYAEQLEAGYSKLLPGLGLLVFMPDYSTVTKSASTTAKKD
jgi:hypothetical protein